MPYVPALLLVQSADVQALGPIVIWSLKGGTEQPAPCCTIFATEWELQKTGSNAYTVCVYSSSYLYFTVNMFHNLKICLRIQLRGKVTSRMLPSSPSQNRGFAGTSFLPRSTFSSPAWERIEIPWRAWPREGGTLGKCKLADL